MWLFERCVPPDAAIVSFEAPLPDSEGGWSWWDVAISDSVNDRSVLAAERVVTALRLFESEFALTPQKRVAVGFSQGAALLSVALQSGKLDVAGIALLAGFVIPFPESSQVASPSPIFVAHGTLDQIVPVERAKTGVQYLQGLGHTVQYVEDEVGHKVGVAATRELKAWVDLTLSNKS
jgi:phospholipase/carboxylesterase